MSPYYKLPRLYVEMPQMAEGGSVTLSAAQAHYLSRVLRLAVGDGVRVFHPDTGEFLATLADGGKKSDVDCPLVERLRPAFVATRRVHLYAPPLAKDRMDFLIEKAVELGATDIHPIVCERSQLRAVNNDRLRAQIVEAAEQCERLDIPQLHGIVAMGKALDGLSGQAYAALERLDEASIPVTKMGDDVSVFIGPPGGWSEGERAQLLTKTTPLSLHENVLRTETAALAALVRLTG